MRQEELVRGRVGGRGEWKGIKAESASQLEFRLANICAYQQSGLAETSEVVPISLPPSSLLIDLC